MSIYSSHNVYPDSFDEDDPLCTNCGFCDINDYCPQMCGDIDE